MASINDGELYLQAPGATEDQLRSALTAARAVLDGAGVDYQAAFDASWKPEYIDDQGTGEMSDKEWELNEVWWNAQKAAFNAIGTDKPSEMRLMTWPGHLEAEKAIADSLRKNPDAELTPAPDPGPRYTIDREALPAA